MKNPIKVGDYIYLIQNKGHRRPRGAYRFLSKGEIRKYRVHYVGGWGGLEGNLVTKGGRLGSTYYLSLDDVVPANWIEGSLEEYL